MATYKDNNFNGKQRGPDGKLYVIPGGPLDPAIKGNTVSAPSYFEGATAGQKAAFDKGVEFVSVGGGVYQNRMGQYVDSSGKATNAPAPTAPKTMDDRAKDLLSGQLQDQQKLADELGLDTQYPTTFEGIIQERADQKAREAAQARAELERQKQLVIQQAGDVKKSAETQIAGVKSALAQDREGPFSTGNVATQQRAATALQEQIDRAISAQNAALQKVQNAEQAIRDAERQGNRELVDAYQGQLEAAKLELAQADTALLNAQVSASEEARAVQDATRKSFETFTSFVDEGQTLTPQGIKNLAGQLNIDFESAFDYYQSAETIRQDKSLSRAEKEVALQDAALELDRKMTNRDLEEVRKVDYLTSLYQSGASADEISAYKQLAGITDENDPLYQAELRVKRAQATIEEKKARGEPITQSDWQTYYENQAMVDDINGTGGEAYVPEGSLEGLSVDYRGGKLVISQEGGFKDYQCGEFVNRVWGLRQGSGGGFGNEYTDKQAVVDNRGILASEVNINNYKQVLKPGMAFVESGGRYGHVGIITQVGENGQFTVMEANVSDGDYSKGDPPIEGTRNIKTDKIYGYAPPPKYQSVQGSNNNFLKMQAESLVTDLGGTGDERQRVIDNMVSLVNSGQAKDLADAKKQLGVITKSDKELQKTMGDEIKDNRKAYDEITQKLRTLPELVEQGTATADVALTVNFLKTIDPQSVARESEVASVEEARGVIDGAAQVMQKWMDGQKLTEEQRNDIVEVARIMRTASADYYLMQLYGRQKELDAQGVPMTFASQSAIQELERVLGNERVKEIKSTVGVGTLESDLNNSINQANDYANKYGSEEASLANQFGLTY